MNEKDYLKIKEAVERYRKGEMLILTDHADREDEGDLVVSAQMVTAEQISFMARYGRGLICIPIEQKRAEALELPLMCESNDSPYSTAFTVSVDACEGTTTGISAFDRLKTVETILNPRSKATDLNRPGHLFPLIAAPGGLKERQGHTEAAVELSRLVDHDPSGVICEIMNDDGTMMQRQDLVSFSKIHNLPLISISEVLEFMERGIDDPVFMPTGYGDFNLYNFSSRLTEHMPHIVLVHKNADLRKTVTIRIHSECLTGDIFGSQRCDCGDQLKKSMEILNKEKGVLLYMRQEGRGIGLVNKLKAYRLQEEGSDTVDANVILGFAPDERTYEEASSILRQLGIEKVDLLTNNPLKVEGLESEGIIVNRRVPLETGFSIYSKAYMETKKQRMNHILELKEFI
jgi:3,4-dihydroxy 2-butanone 4-phosphate synthase/GTP cyclohydrolase II